MVHLTCKSDKKLAVTWLEGYVYAYIYIYIYFFFCDYRSLSASITHGEFDLFVRPSAATYCYKCKYTYGVHDTVSKSSTQYSLCSFATMDTNFSSHNKTI